MVEAAPTLPRAAVAGKIRDLITTGTAPEVSRSCANVDVIELLQFEPVDRNDGIVQPHFLAQMDSDQPADIAVADQDDRMAMREHIGQSVHDAAAE